MRYVFDAYVVDSSVTPKDTPLDVTFWNESGEDLMNMPASEFIKLVCFSVPAFNLCFDACL